MYTLHYTSADEAGPDAPWSVYRERYETEDSAEPIDGLTVCLGSWPSEAEADAEASRLQQAYRSKHKLSVTNIPDDSDGYTSEPTYIRLYRLGHPADYPLPKDTDADADWPWQLDGATYDEEGRVTAYSEHVECFPDFASALRGLAEILAEVRK